ncbi:MAG: hypothetical protein KatS3mg105_0091 [Gemmatales bacterium]|nr:MAG: hypothetical protein KatS3mg105_0091 [Gemmatales bacterium]
MSENMSTLAKPHPYGTKPSPWSVSASGFSVIASAVACLSALCAFGLLFNDAVADLIGFDWVGAIGLSSAIGQKKLIVLKGVLLLAGSAVAVFFSGCHSAAWLADSEPGLCSFSLCIMVPFGSHWNALLLIPIGSCNACGSSNFPVLTVLRFLQTSKWRSADIQLLSRLA